MGVGQEAPVSGSRCSNSIRTGSNPGRARRPVLSITISPPQFTPESSPSDSNITSRNAISTNSPHSPVTPLLSSPGSSIAIPMLIHPNSNLVIHGQPSPITSLDVLQENLAEADALRNMCYGYTDVNVDAVLNEEDRKRAENRERKEEKEGAKKEKREKKVTVSDFFIFRVNIIFVPFLLRAYVLSYGINDYHPPPLSLLFGCRFFWLTPSFSSLISFSLLRHTLSHGIVLYFEDRAFFLLEGGNTNTLTSPRN